MSRLSQTQKYVRTRTHCSVAFVTRRALFGESRLDVGSVVCVHRQTDCALSFSVISVGTQNLRRRSLLRSFSQSPPTSQLPVHPAMQPHARTLPHNVTIWIHSTGYYVYAEISANDIIN